jgi:hypothetical protein
VGPGTLIDPVSELSSKYNIDEMKEDAEAMGHSLEEQKSYMKSPTNVNKIKNNVI